MRDYETLALNIAEIKRYLEQQKEIIVYYEEAVKPRKKKEEKRFLSGLSRTSAPSLSWQTFSFAILNHL